MGERIKCNSCGTEYEKLFLLGKQGNLETCPMCGASMQGQEEHSDWITWYYYKDEKTNCFTLRDDLIDLSKWTDTRLIKEFKAPPRDDSGSSERAKEILRTYIPDAFAESVKQESTICCPRCGSKEYTLLNRGYSVWTGLLGSNKVKRVCNRCKKEF